MDIPLETNLTAAFVHLKFLQAFSRTDKRDSSFTCHWAA